MDDVEHVAEGVRGFLLGLDEFVQERRFLNGMGLGYDQVVSVWEEFEGVVQEVSGSGVKGCFYAEESDGEGVLCFFRGVWYGFEVVNLGYDSFVFVIFGVEVSFGLFFYI